MSLQQEPGVPKIQGGGLGSCAIGLGFAAWDDLLLLSLACTAPGPILCVAVAWRTCTDLLLSAQPVSTSQERGVLRLESKGAAWLSEAAVLHGVAALVEMLAFLFVPHDLRAVWGWAVQAGPAGDLLCSYCFTLKMSWQNEST